MAHTDNEDRLWVRRFWIMLGILVIFSGTIVAYTTQPDKIERKDDSYVPVQVRTQTPDGRNVLCTLSLLVDPEQEKDIESRQALLEIVVKDALTELYQGERRPDMAAVRDTLHDVINRKLPRKLQIREILVQELLVGIS